MVSTVQQLLDAILAPCIRCGGGPAIAIAGRWFCDAIAEAVKHYADRKAWSDTEPDWCR
jgi:hypothetical protein